MSFPSHITKVSLTSDMSIPGASWTTISWDTEIFDTDGAWAIGDPTKIIVPSGMSYAKIDLFINYDYIANFNFHDQIIALGSVTVAASGSARYGNRGQFISSEWISVSPLDEIIARVYIAYTNNCIGDGTHPSWMQAEFS